MKINRVSFWSRINQITECHQHHCCLWRNPLKPLSILLKKLADISLEHPAREQKRRPSIQRKCCKKPELPTTKLKFEQKLSFAGRKHSTCWQRELLPSLGTCTVNTLVSSTVSQANPYTFIKQTSCFQANRNDSLAPLRASAFNF